MMRLLKLLFACRLMARGFGMEQSAQDYDPRQLPEYVQEMISRPDRYVPLPIDVIVWSQKKVPVSIDTCSSELDFLKGHFMGMTSTFQALAQTAAEEQRKDEKQSRMHAFFTFQFACMNLDNFLLSLEDGEYPSMVQLLHVFALVMMYFLAEMTLTFPGLKTHGLFTALQGTFMKGLATRSADIFASTHAALDAFARETYTNLMDRLPRDMWEFVILTSFLNLLASIAKLFPAPILPFSNNDAFCFSIPSRLAAHLNFLHPASHCPDLVAAAKSFKEDLDIFLTGSLLLMRSWENLDFFLYDLPSREYYLFRVRTLQSLKQFDQFQFLKKKPVAMKPVAKEQRVDNRNTSGGNNSSGENWFRFDPASATTRVSS